MKDEGWVGALAKAKRTWCMDRELLAIARAAETDPRRVKKYSLELIKTLHLEGEVARALER